MIFKPTDNLVVIYQVKHIPVHAGSIQAKVKDFSHIQIFDCTQNFFFLYWLHLAFE